MCRSACVADPFDRGMFTGPGIGRFQHPNIPLVSAWNYANDSLYRQLRLHVNCVYLPLKIAFLNCVLISWTIVTCGGILGGLANWEKQTNRNSFSTNKIQCGQN